MKTNIKRTMAVAVLALGSSVFAANSHAALVGLSGSSTIGSVGATITGTDLSAPGLITVSSPFYGLSFGDYAPLSPLSLFTLAGALDLTNMSTFNITASAAFGSYAVSELVIIAQSADFLNVFTRGIFTPGTLEGTQSLGCATGGNNCAPTDTSLRWTFSKAGTAVSAGGSLASPAIPLNSIPEPASLSLLGLGLIGWATSRRKSTKTAAA